MNSCYYLLVDSGNYDNGDVIMPNGYCQGLMPCRNSMHCDGDMMQPRHIISNPTPHYMPYGSQAQVPSCMQQRSSPITPPTTPSMMPNQMYTGPCGQQINPSMAINFPLRYTPEGGMSLQGAPVCPLKDGSMNCMPCCPIKVDAPNVCCRPRCMKYN